MLTSILAGVYAITLAAFLPLLCILPAYLADKLLPNYYGTISDATMAFVIPMMLIIDALLSSNIPNRYLRNAISCPMN
jgi:hypothetical protein